MERIGLNYSQFCSSGWPEIHYEAQIDLKLIAILHWPEYWYHQQESPCLAYAAAVYEVCHWAMSMWLALYKHTVGHILLQVLFGTSWWEHFAAAESGEEPSEGPVWFWRPEIWWSLLSNCGCLKIPLPDLK